MRNLMLGAAVLALAACANADAGTEPTASNVTLTENGVPASAATPAPLPMSGGARAALATADGKDVGTVTASAATDGLIVTVDARNMAAGTYGVHVHTTGKCEAPKFITAGGHWNPTGKQHGSENPAGPHYGDLPNLVVSPRGTGSVSFTIRGANIPGLLDPDGAAFVVHAGPDDYKTDPSGNSGDRIACGVFAAS